MRRYTGMALVAGVIAALLWGCEGSPDVSERRRLAAEGTQPDEVAEVGAESAPGAEAVAAAPSGETADALAALETPDEQPASKAAASRKPGKAKKALLEAPEAASSRGAPASAEDKVLQDMRAEKAFAREEAKYHAKVGDDLYQQNRYREAVDAYRRALDLDPSLDQVRERYNSALLLVGERVGEVPAVATETIQEERVKRQQNLAEIERNMEVARRALAANQVEDAEQAASRAVDLINFQPDYDAAKRREAQDLLQRVRDEKKSRDQSRKAAIIDEARQKAEQDLEDSKKVRDRQVQELLRKAMDMIRMKDYEKTVEICERVLELEPENRVAKFWMRDSRDQILKTRQAQLRFDQKENQKLSDELFAEGSIPYNEIFVFPDEDQWDISRRRSAQLTAISTEEPEQIRRIKNTLEGTTVNLGFDNTSLEDVVQQLRTLTGVPMMIDPQVDASTMTVTMNIQNLPASNALNLILENVGLTYTFKESVLFITNPGQKGGRMEFAIYNVSDLLNKIRDFEGPELMLKPQGEQGSQPISFVGGFAEEEGELDPEKLVELVKASTGGADTWQDPPSIEHHQGQFLVEAPRELHGEVQKVLENLRKDADLFVVIEARFIDVNDDFLEDIGVDSRALGAVNNYGTPWGGVINSTRTGGQDLGFTEKGGNPPSPELVMGQDRWAGRLQQVIDGFTGTIRGERLSGGSGTGGLTMQSTWLEPFQINTIFRAVQERSDVRQLTAPIVTAHNGQRVYVSIITQRAYIADYNLVSGGTGFAIIEVADPEVETFQEGVILDVDPVISYDKKYVTLDVKPTLATLIGGTISTILISLGSFTNVAFQVPIGVPEIALQQSFTSVTVPNGGTVLLGGFKSMNEGKFKTYLPILGNIPIVGFLFKRQATIIEKRSLVILITARIVDLRGEEARKFNPE